MYECCRSIYIFYLLASKHSYVCRKTIFADVCQYIKAYSQRYTELADTITSSMEEVKEDNPYEPFIINKGYVIQNV